MQRRQSIGALLLRLLRIRTEQIGKRPLLIGGGLVAWSLLLLIGHASFPRRGAGRPVVNACTDVESLQRQLQLRERELTNQYSASSLRAVHDGLDGLTLATLCENPSITLTHLQVALRSITNVFGYRLDIRSIGPGELLVLFSGTVGDAWGSGGRAAVFSRTRSGWRRTGYFDFYDGAIPGILGVRSDGIAMLEAVAVGNGAPPTQLVAVASAGDRLLAFDSGFVFADLTLQDTGTLIASRYARHLGRYPAEPLLRYAVKLVRTSRGLAANEHLLTPWVLAIDEFCGGNRSVASPQLLAPSAPGAAPGLTTAACDDVGRFRAGRGAVSVALRTELDWKWQKVELTLRPRQGRWRIVDVN